MSTSRAPRVRSRQQARADRRVLPPDPARRASPIKGLLLDGRKVDMQVGDRLIDATLDRTIEGPNTITLTLWNGDRAVLKSGVFGQRVMSKVARIELDGLGFIAAGVSKQGDQLLVSFEDEFVAHLKQHGKGKPLRRSRGTTTRAHFCAEMIRAAGVPVIVLDEDVVQRIAGRKKLKRELLKAQGQVPSGGAGGGRKSKKGIQGDVTVKGVPATSEQRRNVAAALGVANTLNASTRAKVAMLVAGIGEGQWKTHQRNLQGGSALGPFQIVSGTAQALRIDPTDVTAAARRFLIAGFGGVTLGAIRLARKHPDYTPGRIALICEYGRDYNTPITPAFYDQWAQEAATWLAAESGGTIGFDTSGADAGVHAWIKAYNFERRKKESTWRACWRLLVEEVGWRIFVREGVVVIASDPALMRADAALQISENDDAVATLDFDWHRALKIGEMTGQAYVGRWQADPGEPLQVKDLPPTTRDWLLAAVSESLLGTKPLADITIRAPQKPKPEPSSEVGTSQLASGGGGGAGDTSGLYAACVKIDKQNLPYVWGGGHGHAGTPDTGTPGPSIHDGTSDPNAPGYDCSGCVGAALAMAGLGLKIGDPVPGSGWFATNWGKPGRGKTFTVWARADHIFIELHFPGKAGKSLDTRPTDNGPSGPHLRRVLGSTGGFTARHWPNEGAVNPGSGSGVGSGVGSGLT